MALSLMSGWFSWVALGVIVAIVVVVGWAMFRSTSKWKSPPPKTPEAMDAEARLWSTRSMDQR